MTSIEALRWTHRLLVLLCLSIVLLLLPDQEKTDYANAQSEIRVLDTLNYDALRKDLLLVRMGDCPRPVATSTPTGRLLVAESLSVPPNCDPGYYIYFFEVPLVTIRSTLNERLRFIHDAFPGVVIAPKIGTIRELVSNHQKAIIDSCGPEVDLYLDCEPSDKCSFKAYGRTGNIADLEACFTSPQLSWSNQDTIRTLAISVFRSSQQWNILERLFEEAPYFKTPGLGKLWTEIRDKTPSQALSLVIERGESKRGKIQLLGLNIEHSIIGLAAPIGILALLVLCKMHLAELQRLSRSGDQLKDQLQRHIRRVDGWYLLYNSVVGSVARVMMFVLLPLGALVIIEINLYTLEIKGLYKVLVFPIAVLVVGLGMWAVDDMERLARSRDRRPQLIIKG